MLVICPEESGQLTVRFGDSGACLDHNCYAYM